MKFYTRKKLIKPGDLNANNTLFGGALLRWIDEEAGIYAMTKLGTKKVVTKFMSEIDFLAPSKQGDVIEIGLAFLNLGRTSKSLRCAVRNIFTKENIISIEKIVFVKVDDTNNPCPHNKTVEDMHNYPINPI